MIVPDRIDYRLYHAPLETPVTASFGGMKKRTSLFIKIMDRDGAHGWGEIWCNYPENGGENRIGILKTVFEPLLSGQSFDTPQAAFAWMTARTSVLALQCGEPGPFSQIIGGIDGALWDIYAKKKNSPIHMMLGNTEPADRTSVLVYASGINPDGCARMIQKKQQEGYSLFKTKIGFDFEQDIRTIEDSLAVLRPDDGMAVDVNQGWEYGEAIEMASKLSRYPLLWIEEPLRADSSNAQWDELKRALPIPLAAGENIRGMDSFEPILESDAITIFQPDACKWGGISGCFELGKAVLRAGRKFYPHYLGGAIGQLASAHILAAVGGDGALEMDANDNPLRESVFHGFPQPVNGRLELPGESGLGMEPDFERIQAYLVQAS